MKGKKLGGAIKQKHWVTTKNLFLQPLIQMKFFCFCQFWCKFHFYIGFISIHIKSTNSSTIIRKGLEIHLLQPGAGTIKPEIISSLMTGGSDGGGGQTNDSIMSSVERITHPSSGGSVRDDLVLNEKKNANYKIVTE